LHGLFIAIKNANQLIRNVERSVEVIPWREWYRNTVEDFCKLLLMIATIDLQIIIWFGGILQVDIFLSKVIAEK
jgi:hypothetical protein